jgi:nitrogen regulatory protein PII
MVKEAAAMKKIEAFLKPFTVDPVRASLAEVGVMVVRVLPVEELSHATSYTEVCQGIEYEVDSNARVLMVVIAPDEDVDEVVRRIQEAGQTDHLGDGGILVSRVEQLAPVDPKAMPVNPKAV